MKKRHIDRLETQLEQLIEGAFSNLFGKRIRAQDLALRLARAMEDAIQPPRSGDPRPIAPDRYVIYAHPTTQEQLIKRYQNLSQTLTTHLVELATDAGYRLLNPPQVKILADPELEKDTVNVSATHANSKAISTAAMQPIRFPTTERPINPQLIINNDRVVKLEQDFVNIGRHPDNHIIIDDPTVSRHHLQLRLRMGGYALFDVRSGDSNTLVNNNPIREHRLKTGDVIRIGRTQIVYMDEDETDSDDQVTEAFDPL